VRKLLKGFLVAAGILLALAGVAVLAINLYVQSAGTQKRIEDALSNGLKAPVHVTSTLVTPWSGLKASGITVPQMLPATGNFLEAASFTARFGWLALYKHRIEASDLSLDEPRVTWFQSANGRWELPRAVVAPQPSPVPVPAPASRATRAPGAPWAIQVRKLTVNGGSFDFWDDKGNLMIEFAGVQFDCLDPRSSGTHGHASSNYVSLHDILFFHDMRTDWSFGPDALKLSAFQVAVGGGQIRGDAQVATQVKHSPFNADVNFDGVNVDQLMIEAGQLAGQVTGTLKGWLDLDGNSGKRSSVNGSAHLELAGGRMQDIELFQLLGQGLQIPDLVELNLKTAQADARVVSGVVCVDKLLLETQNLQLAAHGTIDQDGKLKLDARLTIDSEIGDRLPAFILTYFKTGASDNARFIDFGIGNTLAHPKTNLLENILGHRIEGQMTDLFKTIFGHKHKQTAPAAVPPP